MSLPIVFRKCISPVNKFDKDFDSGSLSVSVDLKESTDIFKPTFVILTSDNLWEYNYIDAIESFGRKYFVTNIRSIYNNRYEVDAKTDVLSTWASRIRSNTAVIRRQQNLFNLYLDDPDFHVLNYEKIQTLQFPTSNGFMKSLQYVLVTNGAGSNSESKDSSQLEKEGEDDERGLKSDNIS